MLKPRFMFPEHRESGAVLVFSFQLVSGVVDGQRRVAEVRNGELRSFVHPGPGIQRHVLPPVRLDLVAYSRQADEMFA